MNDKVLTVTEFARLGGEATKKRYGSEHYKKIQKIGVENRRRRKLVLETTSK